MDEVVTKRILPIRRDIGGSNAVGSLRVTVTQELFDLGIDLEKDDLEKAVTVKLVKDKNGKKRIVIERIEKDTRETRNELAQPESGN